MEEEGLLFSIIIWLFLIEIAVGASQLTGGLIRTIIKLNSEKSLEKLKTYWIIVVVYLVVFIILYCLLIYFQEKSFAHSYEHYNESTGEYDYSKENSGTNYWNYLGYTYKAIIVWTSLAWLIAIWYWKNIVFTKANITTITKLFKK